MWSGQNKQISRDRKWISGFQGLGIGEGWRVTANGLGVGGCCKYSKIRLWRWSYNFANVLENTELYTSSGWTYVNYTSVKLFKKKVSAYVVLLDTAKFPSQSVASIPLAVYKLPQFYQQNMMSYILIFTNLIDGKKGISFKKIFHFSMSDCEHLFICVSTILTSVFVDCVFSVFLLEFLVLYSCFKHSLYIVVSALCDIVSYF